MMDDRNDINRPPGSDPYLNRRPVMTGRRGYGWSIPVAIAALLLIAGFMFYNSGGHGPDRTANNNTSTTMQTNPSSPERPVPPTAPTPAR
jgi:hypothetical protein